MRNIVQRVLLSAAALTLSACSTLTGWLDTPDPRHEIIADLANQIEPKALWSQDIGDYSGDYIGDDDIPEVHSRLVSGNRALYAADGEGRVSALTHDGKPIWRKEFNIPVSFGLGGTPGLLFLGGVGGEVVAIRGRDGKERWRKKLGARVTAISAARNDTVIVRTANFNITALDARTGRELWQEDIPAGSLTIRGMSAPLIYHGVVIVGSDDGNLVLFDLDSGEEINRLRIAPKMRGENALDQIADIDGRVVIKDDTLFVSSYRGPTMAVDLRSQRVLWSVRDIGSNSGPLVTRRAVYVVKADGGVVAIERSSGKILWRNTLLEVKRLTYPATAGAYVVAGDDDGYFYWLSKRRGKILAHRSAGSGKVMSLQSLPGGRVAVLTGDGDLTVFRARTGAR